ncbi:peroxisome assembly protein 12-like [Antedon mediterranea]|uniref:peroxisome assembly protein 12-like n=1 Tax=Antedon mediterranea TaxID=105859 RepID=UPI003AF6035E
MAEFGAHLTGSVQTARPTYFEVIAQEGLMIALRPAMQYTCKILAERNPEHLGWLFRYADELYTILDSLLQHHFLLTTAASFSENFYGLKRVVIDGKGREDKTLSLPWKQHLLSMFCLVVMPYIKIKMEKLFHTFKEEDIDGYLTSTSDPLTRLKKTFLFVYPLVHMSWEGSALAYQMAYLFKKSDCHSPFVHLSGVKLSNLTRADMLNLMTKNETETQETTSGMNWLLEYSKKFLAVSAHGISQGLSVAVFFLQFLEWWYASENQESRIAVTSLPTPPPPSLSVEHDNGKFKSNICPICNRPLTNDTAISTSGYVFCYPCIYGYVKKHQCCPVTKYPTLHQHLIKLYLPD